MTAGASVTADPLPPGARVALSCHFGEWLQGRIGPSGPVGLVTLLPAVTGMTGRRRAGALAACRFGQGAGSIPLPRLRRFLADLGLPPEGRFQLRPRFTPGSGTGMSTASLLAVARLAGYAGPRDRLVRACLRAEGASDPLMLEHPDCHLWASRRGEVLQALPPPPLPTSLSAASTRTPADTAVPSVAVTVTGEAPPTMPVTCTAAVLCPVNTVVPPPTTARRAGSADMTGTNVSTRAGSDSVSVSATGSVSPLAPCAM